MNSKPMPYLTVEQEEMEEIALKLMEEFSISLGHKKKCECGASAVGSHRHSHYCPLDKG